MATFSAFTVHICEVVPNGADALLSHTCECEPIIPLISILQHSVESFDMLLTFWCKRIIHRGYFTLVKAFLYAKNGAQTS